VIEAVVLRPLPFADADRLVWLNGKMPQTDDAGVSPADFLDYRDANRSFEQMAGISQVVMAGPSNLSGDKPEQVTTNLVSAGFFQTLGVPLLFGRDFQKSDEQVNTSQVVILGNGIWKRDVLGKHLELLGDSQPDREIAGIVGNIRHRAPSDPQQPEMYVAYAQYAPPTMNLVVRTSGNPSALESAVCDAVRALDKDETLSAFRSLDDIVESSVAQPRFSSLLLGMFAALALALAAVGLYGLMAYSVTQRTNEIGIRMALGAKQGDVLRMIVMEGMRPALAGLAIGIASSLAFGRFLASMLFEVKTSDPVTFVWVCLGLIGVTLLSNYIPARRAANVDPMVALRYE